MCSLEREECIFESKFANSLYFSLLAGNSGGERLAPDCPLRQPVWAAEKMSGFCREIRKNARIRVISSAKRTGENELLGMNGVQFAELSPLSTFAVPF